MANIIAIKRRISATQNVSKTTRAMQMIAASKLKRSQEAALASKPYVEKISVLSQSLTAKLDKENLHEYIRKKEGIDKTLIIVFSPDKGLCGGLVSNLIKELLNIKSITKNLCFVTIGKKIEKTVAKLNGEIIASFDFGNILPSFDKVYSITSIIDNNFLNNKISSVKVLSTRFASVFSQSPKLTNILPIELPPEQTNSTEFTLFEPSSNELLPAMLKRYLEMSIYQLLLENYASEQGARMVAMQNATENALDIIQSLKLEYNKERQEKITNEILDISSNTLANII